MPRDAGAETTDHRQRDADESVGAAEGPPEHFGDGTGERDEHPQPCGTKGRGSNGGRGEGGEELSQFLAKLCASQRQLLTHESANVCREIPDQLRSRRFAIGPKSHAMAPCINVASALMLIG